MIMRRTALATLILGLTFASATPGSAQQKRAALGFEDPTLPRIPAVELPREPGKFVTGIPVVQRKNDGPAEPMLTARDFADNGLFPGRVSLRADGGDGVGYARGFTYLQAMVPLLEDRHSLLFADVRAVNFLDENRWEYNVGGGYRCYSPSHDCIFGSNIYYDARKTDYHLYHQIASGWEVLGRRLELRGNGYFIVGAGHHVVRDTDVVNLGIINNNFVSRRIRTIEAALGGGDIEFGGRLPFAERYCPRAFVGFYTYSAERIGVANGVRVRMEAQLSERVSLHAQVQNDQLFHTTGSAGIAIHFGAPAYRRGNADVTWDDVMHQRVQRDVNVVTSTATTITTTTTPVPPPPPPPPPPSEEPEFEKTLPK
ncbi:MAG: inverse autotransporter beta domain-containing protein [Planctomycetes bacterium]|nr:inverse autotransporter beta domain-containing protein [Planctomycetota bacterium]